FGRRLMLRWCYLQLVITGTCTAVAPTFLIYCSLRFLAGVAVTTILANGYFLIVEWTSYRFQAMGTRVTVSTSCIGLIILGGLAFAIRDWQTLQLVFSVPLFVIFLSSRYAIILSHYGLNIHLQQLGSNVFLLQCLFGTVIPSANYVALWAINHMGRRVSQMLFMFLLGICILAIIFMPQEMQTLRVTLSALGVAVSSAATLSSVTHGNELIPPVIRATALGIIGIAGNLGATVAPLLMILKVYSPHLPWIIYAAFSIIGGLIVFLLPETRNQPLPDTILDVEN
ncbi:solute carrier family 22 member 9, partial [Daubentonia madagascariensis]